MKGAHPYELENSLDVKRNTVKTWIQQGYAFFLGLDCTPDFKKACYYFKKAARKGDQHSRNLLDQMKQYCYFWQLGSPDSSDYDFDNPEGIQLIMGLYLAQAGWIEKGIRNCPGSIYWFKKAFKWLRWDSDAHPFAREFLKRRAAGMDATIPVIQFIKQQASNHFYYSFIWGVCLERGLSVERDEKTAFRLYMEASDAGQYYAFAALSRCYAKGIAVPVNRRMAAVYKEKYHEARMNAHTLLGFIDVSDDERTVYTQKNIQKQPVRSDGKSICRTLRTLRARFADANHLPWHEPDCHQRTPCSGTCPACEKALRKLEKLAQDLPDCTYPLFDLISHKPDVAVKPIKLKPMPSRDLYIERIKSHHAPIQFKSFPENITTALKQSHIYTNDDLYYYLSLENAPLLPGLTEGDWKPLRKYTLFRGIELKKIPVSKRTMKRFFISLQKKQPPGKHI